MLRSTFWSLLLLAGILLSSILVQAQPIDQVGVEVQVYPAGVILGLKTGILLDDGHEFNLRVGYNITRRGDFGVHDNEEGGGPGFGFGYRYRIEEAFDERAFIGARADLWFMDLDWRDRQPDRVGTTSITVLQPTLEAGYDLLDRSDWRLQPTISFGYEFNVDTDGEEVGEGPILLGGLNALYNF